MHVRVGRRMALASALGMAAVALLALGGGSGGGAYGVHAQTTHAGFQYAQPPNDLHMSVPTTHDDAAHQLFEQILYTAGVLSHLFQGAARRVARVRGDSGTRLLQLGDRHRTLCERVVHLQIKLTNVYRARSYALLELQPALALLATDPTTAAARMQRVALDGTDAAMMTAAVTDTLAQLKEDLHTLSTKVRSALRDAQSAARDAEDRAWFCRAATAAGVVVGAFVIGHYYVAATAANAVAAGGSWAALKAWTVGLFAGAAPAAAAPGVWAAAAAKGASVWAALSTFASSAHGAKLGAVAAATMAIDYLGDFLDEEAAILRAEQARLVAQHDALQPMLDHVTTVHAHRVASSSEVLWRDLVARHADGRLADPLLAPAHTARVADCLQDVRAIAQALAALPSDVHTCTAAVDKFERDVLRAA